MGWDFQIVQVTAAGTFGTVCVAFDWTSRKFYALKVLKERFKQNDKVLARARDEAKLLSAMKHPNILRVHELFEVDGRPVIVMQWIQGCALHDLLDCTDGGLPYDVALDVVRQGCTGLDAAYRALAPGSGQPMRIIHRDLKPSNLLLSLRGVVKVVDFGIAKAVFHGRESDTVSMVLGTRAYMAPERLDGQNETAKLDIYAMGIILYELLQGEPPKLSLRPRVHGLQARDAAKALAPAGCPPEILGAIRQLWLEMVSYEPAGRLQAHEVVARIDALTARMGGRPDMAAFANTYVRPVFEANSLVDPRTHEAYPELAFIDAIGPTPPGGDPHIDRTLTRFLHTPGWERRVEELWTLLLLNPSWTARPFLRWLERKRAHWWQFWQDSHATVPQKIALLRILSCRMDDEVRARVKRFLHDPDPRVRRLAKALLAAEEVSAF